MKNLNQRHLILFFALFLFSSLSFSQNNKYYYKQKKEFTKKFKNYAYVPSGGFTQLIDGKERKISFRWFYMLKTEVSNFNWLEYTSDFKNKYGVDSLKSVLPDSTLWGDLNKDSLLQKLYHFHPAYYNYPVVNITKDQAEKYCEWLTDRLNSEGTTPFKKVVCRLPLESEWEYAAQGDQDGNVFPWNGEFQRDYKGFLQANFLRVNQAAIQYNDQGELIINTTSPSIKNKEPKDVNSYTANEYGLLNMSGNVAEFVQEDGITKGGSFMEPGYYLNIFNHNTYSNSKSAAPNRGFRVVVQIVEY